MITKEYLIYQYIEKKRSTYDIAIINNTYANRIRRLLKHYGIPLRDKSEAQSVAIETGRHKHPTKGQKITEKVKLKIGAGVAKAWNLLTDTEKERRINLAKQQWEMMPEKLKEKFRKLAAIAIRKAADKGSKLEHYLLIELQRYNYKVIFHKNHMVSNEQLHVDLYLPELRVAIEIDGPTHFLPIWGEDSLAKHIISDHTKTGLLLAGGYVLIRIKNLAKNISKIQCYNVLTKLLNRLELIKLEFPKESYRLIEIEVN